jgi:very-short-patch-repair endonuclease
VHHARSSALGERTRRLDLPVTTPLRTLVDVAAAPGAHSLARVVEEAQLRRLVSGAQLLAVTNRPGATALRDAVRLEPSMTRSEAERRLLALVERAGLPRPRTNVRVAGHEVDALWPRERLIAEVDGYAFHSSRVAFERDRLRDSDLQLAGHTVLRLTWRQLTTRPEAVAARLATALARGHVR